VIVEFSRRKFLMGAAGTALALPVLEALTPKTAFAAFENVRRFIFIVSANGSPRTSRPSGTGTGYTLGPILKGLEKHKADMLFVAGLDSKAAALGNGDPHATGFAATLSGFKALPGTEFKHGACFEMADCRGTGWGGGPSVDQLIAKQHIAAKVPIVHGSLNFAVKNAPGSLYTRMSYSEPGKPVTPEASPVDAFDRIFGKLSVPSTTPDAAAKARLALRQTSVLDEVRNELTSLQMRVGKNDRERLEAHVTGLRELEARIARTNPGGMTTACKVPSPKPTLGPGNLVERNAGGMETNVNADKNDNLVARHDIWQKMTIAALNCDLTRVVTVMFAPSRADTFMSWLKEDSATYQGNFDLPHHERSHANDKTTLTSMDLWYAKRVASYVDDLKATMDSTGKPLFDTTGVGWFNELGEGPDHSHTDKPHVILGSMGGFFKTGQLVKYPAGTPHNVLLTAIAQAMGVETAHVGEPSLTGGDVSLLKASAT
jgi:hypothetical protein